MTLSMLGLAGIPATAGFVGKFYLIDASVAGGYTWLGVVIVIGSMISLGYYLPVVAAMWMGDTPEAQSTPAPAGPDPEGALPALAGGSPELDRARPLPHHRAPAGGGPRRAPGGRRDAVLRHHPPAPVRPRAGSRQRAGAALACRPRGLPSR